MKLNIARIAELVDVSPGGAAGRSIRWAHQAKVNTGVVAMILATQPGFIVEWRGFFAAWFWIIAVIFAAEYVVRLWVAPEAHWAHRGEGWRARWHWATQFTGLADLGGSLPVVALACGMPSTQAQLFGALWLLKLVPYASGLNLLGRVLRNARRTLLGLLFGFVTVLVIAATLAYVAEGARQPDTFGSVPLALWWAVSTLTTVGYGDAVPVTLLGRVVAGVVMICGIGLCALWTAILVTGFSNEMRRSEFLRTWNLVARVPYFQGLGAGTIGEVALLLRPSDFSAGSTIVRRGQPGDCMYFIVTGEVQVEIRPPLKLQPGDFFGELALITGEPRSATATAVTDCELLHLDLADFRQIEARHPELAQLIDAEAKRRRQSRHQREPARG